MGLAEVGELLCDPSIACMAPPEVSGAGSLEATQNMGNEKGVRCDLYSRMDPSGCCVCWGSRLESEQWAGQ